MKIKSLCFLSLILAFVLAFCAAGCNDSAKTYTISNTSISINVGESETLVVSDGTNNVTATWQSENAQIATIDNGVVTGVSAGTTNIIATVEGVTLTCAVTVNQANTHSYVISQTSKTLKKGSSFTLSVSEGAQTISEVSWFAGNTNATVDANGVVTGVSVGLVTIYGQIGEDMVSCEVRIVDYTINQTNIVLDIDEQFALSVFDGLDTATTATWTIEGTAAAISEKGVVIGVTEGTAIVKAVIDGEELTCNVTVKQYSISETTKQLKLFEDFTLKVFGGNQELTSVWSVNGDSVTVDNGIVTAVKAGTSIVTAVAEGKTLTCEVEVIAPDTLPVLSLAISDNKTIIETGDTVTITPSFTYGEEIEDYTGILYKSSSAVNIIQENGIATVSAVAFADSVDITATIDWYGIDISQTITVKVVKTELSFDKTSIKLFADASGGEISASLIPSLKVNENVTTEGLSVVSEDSNIATYDNGVVTAVKAGRTNIVASYTSESGKVFTATCEVLVEFINIDKTDIDPQVLYKASSDGTNGIDFSDYDIDATSDGFVVYDITDAVPVLIESTRSGNVYTLDREDLIGGTERTLQIVKDGKFAYSFKVVVVSKIVRTADDVTNLISYANKTIVGEAGMNVYDYNGYYILNNNIDLTGKTINANVLGGDSAGAYEYNGKVGFSGTFDGQGYVLYGGTYGPNGLFGLTKNGSVIKNVAFVGHTLANEGHTLAFTVGSKVEDVLVDVAVAGDESDALANYASGAEIYNVVTYFPKTNTHAYGLVNYLLASNFNYAENVATSIRDVYVFGGANNGNDLLGYSNNYFITGEHSTIVWSLINAENGKLGANADQSFSGFNSSIWNTDGTRASFRTFTEANPNTPYTYVKYTDIRSNVAVKNTSSLTINFDNVTYTATADTLRACPTGEVKVPFVNNGRWVNVPVTIITAEIKDADDIVYFEKYVEKEYVDSSTNLFNYDGYFVLTNNIDLTGRTVQFQFGSGDSSGRTGFQGTFDGQGYTIYGGTYLKGGIFASLGENSVVKNVAFVNAQVGTTDEPGYVLGDYVGGTITDVLVDANVLANVWQIYGLSSQIAGGDLTNVVVYLNNVNSVNFTDGIQTFGGYVGRPGGDVNSYKTSTMTNCYSIGGQIGGGYLGYSNDYQIAEGLDIKQFDEGTNIATINFDGFDSDMWNFSGEHARFNSYCEVPMVGEISYVQYTGLDENNNFTRIANTEDLVITWDGGSITISAEELLGIQAGNVNFVYKATDSNWYDISLVIYTAVLKNANDIIYLQNYVDRTDYTAPATEGAFGSWAYTGNFILGADINLGTNVISTPLKGENASLGFNGTFDGRGYTIRNGVYDRGGLFGTLGAKGVVKNLAFVGATLNAYYWTGKAHPAIIAHYTAGTIDNCLIGVNRIRVLGETGSDEGRVLGATFTGKLSNTVIYFNDSIFPYYAIADYCSESCFDNVYMLMGDGFNLNVSVCWVNQHPTFADGGAYPGTEDATITTDLYVSIPTAGSTATITGSGIEETLTGKYWVIDEANNSVDMQEITQN